MCANFGGLRTKMDVKNMVSVSAKNTKPALLQGFAGLCLAVIMLNKYRKF